MRIRGSLSGTALALALSVVAASAADAQRMSPLPPSPGAFAPQQFESFYTRYSLAADRGGDRVPLDGYGARVMWGLPVGDPEEPTPRASLGLAATFTPVQGGMGFSTLYAGLEGDVQPLATPLFGRVAPFLTAGVGAFRTDVARPGPHPAPLADRTNTSVAVTAGAGSAVHLTRGLALRGDVRDVITFRGRERHNLAFGLGLGVQF